MIGVNAERIEKFDYSCRLGEKLQAGMTRGRTLVPIHKNVCVMLPLGLCLLCDLWNYMFHSLGTYIVFKVQSKLCL